MSHDDNTASLRAKLGQTHAMLGQIKAQDEAISKGAAERYEQVVKRLAELHSKAVTDRDAANEYLDLTKEKGALLRTLAKS